jgi:hypothetical protein
MAIEIWCVAAKSGAPCVNIGKEKALNEQGLK